MKLQIRPIHPFQLSVLDQISIAFEVRERALVDGGLLVGFEPVAHSWTKDYDLVSCPPSGYPSEFDCTHWGFLAAIANDIVMGGITIATSTPKFQLLEGREDLAHIVDLRVSPEFRGQGVGRELWNAAEDWCLARGIVEIRVETQDINVPGCKFYQGMGCKLLSINPDAYDLKPPETQFIFGKLLPTNNR